MNRNSDSRHQLAAVEGKEKTQHEGQDGKSWEERDCEMTEFPATPASEKTEIMSWVMPVFPDVVLRRKTAHTGGQLGPADGSAPEGTPRSLGDGEAGAV